MASSLRDRPNFGGSHSLTHRGSLCIRNPFTLCPIHDGGHAATSGVMVDTSGGDSDLGSEWASAPVTQTISSHNVCPQFVALQRGVINLPAYHLSDGRADRHPGP